MTKYKIIKRDYYEDYTTNKESGFFVARGQWADGHLAYSRCDANGNVIDDNDCCYVQLRYSNGGLYMQRI